MKFLKSAVKEIAHYTSIYLYSKANITFGNLTPKILKMKKSPAAEKNKEPLLNVLKQIVPKEPTFALEVASGTGQHVCYFAEHLAHITWLPTECDQNSIHSIKAYRESSPLENILEPCFLNTTDPVDQWTKGAIGPNHCDIILCVNMIHISPWKSTEGLFIGSSHYLKSGGLLVTYGPYKLHGEIIPESNVQFDKMLKLQNSEWGLRDVDDLEKLAQENGLKLEQIIDMPANNKTVVFKKS